MKKFLLWVVLCMFAFASVGNIALADNAQTEGDVYYQNLENWPYQHWVFMDDSEIASFEADGWVRRTGELWYDANHHHDPDDPKIQDVSVEDVQELYNEGYTFHLNYTWVCPKEIQQTYGNQSVSVGYWILSPDEVCEYLSTYVKPEIKPNSNHSVSFVSEWYYKGQLAIFDGTETEEELNKFSMVRNIFETYNYGFGSKLYLRNGMFEEYSYSEAVEISQTISFSDELPVWN
ncbi:MAG: hypothetical protein J6C46_06245 [Clostridia bacterium]|nr:hypothetical protein [Clostridia bacterium]